MGKEKQKEKTERKNVQKRTEQRTFCIDRKIETTLKMKKMGKTIKKHN